MVFSPQAFGRDVSEDKTTFNKWIFSPNQALSAQTGNAIMDNQFGREKVRNIIGRNEYAVYS